LVNLKDKGTVAPRFVDLNVLDELLVDGGMVWFEVVEKIGIDVKVLVH
jgi:hypothetical protein